MIDTIRLSRYDNVGKNEKEASDEDYKEIRVAVRENLVGLARMHLDARSYLGSHGNRDLSKNCAERSFERTGPNIRVDSAQPSA